MSARNSEFHNQEFLEHINSHCRRTSKITSGKYLKKGKRKWYFSKFVKELPKSRNRIMIIIIIIIITTEMMMMMMMMKMRVRIANTNCFPYLLFHPVPLSSIE